MHSKKTARGARPRTKPVPPSVHGLAVSEPTERRADRAPPTPETAPGPEARPARRRRTEDPRRAAEAPRPAEPPRSSSPVAPILMLLLPLVGFIVFGVIAAQLGW